MLAHFASLKAPELQEYILARLLTLKRKRDLTGLMKLRSALADAVQGGRNLVSVAFDIGNNKSRLKVVVKEED